MSFAVMTLFISISVKLTLDFEYIPNIVSMESVKNKYFDYIIVGGGTAGEKKIYHSCNF
jgi:hypothetical protein